MKFYDYLKINIDGYGNYDTNRLTDNILESVETQKTYRDHDQLEGLMVDSIDAHSMKLTSHFHLYLPASMQQSIDSLTDPYNIPVLTHHDLYTDAIGRVVGGKYVNTFDTFKHNMLGGEISDFLGMSLSTKNIHTKLRKYNNILFTKGNLGLGRLETTSNIVNEDAITKILNKTYDTISMGYDTNSIVCSECGNSYYDCDHTTGEDYGHGPTYIIFGKLRYFEKSYVNAPADENAGNTSYLKIHKKDNAKKDNVAIKYLANSGCAGQCDVNFTFNDSINKQQTNGALMKIKEFKKLGDSLYSQTLEKMPEDSRLTLDEVKSLDDDAFVGSKRLVLANSTDAVNASILLLNEVEDCDEKAELLDFLNKRLEATNNNVDKNLSQDDNTDESKLTFTFVDEKWSLADEKEDKEKALLSVLVQKYSDSKEDAQELIDSILNDKEFKNELVTSLATDELADMMARIDNFKYESKVQQAKYSALVQTADSLASELKDNYIEKLLSFRTKEDPSLDSDTLREQFKGRSLDSLKSTYSDMVAIFTKLDSNTNSNLEDDNINIDSNKNKVKFTPKQIQEMKDEQSNNYRTLLNINFGQAEKYMIDSTKRIKELIESSKEN